MLSLGQHAIAAAESSDPHRAVVRATNSVIFRVAFFYVGWLYIRAGVKLSKRRDWGVFTTASAWSMLLVVWGGMGAALGGLLYLNFFWREDHGGYEPLISTATWWWITAGGAGVGALLGLVFLLILRSRHVGAVWPLVLATLRRRPEIILTPLDQDSFTWQAIRSSRI